MANPAPADGKESPNPSQLDLSWLPPVFMLATNLTLDEQHEAENALSARGAPVTYDIHEAKVFIGSISRAQRARLELRWKGLRVEDVERSSTDEVKRDQSLPEDEPIKKKRRTSNNEHSGSMADATDERINQTSHLSHLQSPHPPLTTSVGKATEKSFPLPSLPSLPDLGPDDIIVVRLGWLNAITSANRLLPLDANIVLHARKLSGSDFPEPAAAHTWPVEADSSKETDNVSLSKGVTRTESASIIERARADPQPKSVYSRYSRRDRIAEAAKQDIVGKSFSSSHVTRPPRLVHQTTSEDLDASKNRARPVPDWILQNKIYSCERATPPDSLNLEFIDLLKTIRLARELTLDQIGVRAYSTSIAALAAYPYALQTSSEVLSLPGCDTKIAHLFHEYNTTGQLQAVLDINADPALTCLRSFFDIWGVGAITAREFYYDRGWRDLDDIVEYGWKTLSRVQQIGLKYYDEFKEPLTRVQVETIAETITQHSVRVTDSRIQTAIVGGYRRGKSVSNDVDIILSHPEESNTLNLITKVVNSLEKEGWITHTLTLHLTTTNRDQSTLPINTATVAGHGFDSLDKALVVWQSPRWPTQDADLAADPNCKNPNAHRRVDIIISPWRTVGCAVAGWTSGTTFQRDLRRYCKYKKGWKFDSSGVRERGTGAWVDLEGYRDVNTRCKTWQEAEKKVFEGLGLEWREPWERCTG